MAIKQEYASNPVPPHMEFPKMVECPERCGRPIWLHHEDSEGPFRRVCWKCQEEKSTRMARAW